MAKPATLELSIEGMTCASCAGRVERALGKVAGVSGASVNLASERARVSLDRELANSERAPAALLEAVRRAGYQAQLATAPVIDAHARQRKIAHEHAWLAVAFLFALPLLLPMALMPLGIDFSLPAWAQFALATPVQFVAGARFYRAAWRALAARAANMDLLVALGTSAAYGLSLFLWARAEPGHSPHLYFETAALVIALVLLGKALEGTARRRASGAIRALEALRPATATRLEAGVARTVPVASLRRGDRLLIRPGERIAADGLVLEGQSHVNEAMLTGEALPVAKAVGDPLSGGGVNGEGTLVLEVTATGSETLLEGIIALVESAQAAKPPVQRSVDRVSQVFVPAIVMVALLTFIAWYIAVGSLEQALVTAVSVLVIACPCALGLATPAAILAGTGIAARQGVLLKDIGVIQAAGKVRHIVFDKTGTLTKGTPELAAVCAHSVTNNALLALAGALALGSEHSLAHALVRACEAQGIPLVRGAAIQALPGRGITGQVNNRVLVLGNHRLLGEASAIPEALRAETAQWEAQGMSVSWVLEQGPQPQVLGAMGFADEVRPEAAATVAYLHQQGMACHLLTGDNSGSAARVAAAVGLTQVHAGMLPAAKAQYVAGLAAEAPVVMVGDGINDAPALAAATLGIAMAGGTDVAARAGGVLLARANLSLVPAAIDIAAKIQRKIHQNLFWAFAYNLVGIPLAAAGALSPVFAGAAMALSSVSVVTNALLLGAWVPPAAKRG